MSKLKDIFVQMHWPQLHHPYDNTFVDFLIDILECQLSGN